MKMKLSFQMKLIKLNSRGIVSLRECVFSLCDIVHRAESGKYHEFILNVTFCRQYQFIHFQNLITYFSHTLQQIARKLSSKSK